jgi:hypothetical protein
VRLRTSARLAWQVIDGEAVLIDLAEGRSLGLNPTGTLIWSLLVQQQDEAAIVERVVERFAVSPEAARADVGAFLRLLQDRGLLVADG